MFSVIQFPGSNDDRDMQFALKGVLGAESTLVWHKRTGLPADTRAVVLPGGFSYGDYLRCGAMAHYSPIMAAVKRFADAGGLVLGVCNGFQVLCEAGLLPGALMRNGGLKFVCRDVLLRVETSQSLFTCRYEVGQVIRIPIAHGDGNYFADGDTLARLHDRVGRQGGDGDRLVDTVEPVEALPVGHQKAAALGHEVGGFASSGLRPGSGLRHIDEHEAHQVVHATPVGKLCPLGIAGGSRGEDDLFTVRRVHESTGPLPGILECLGGLVRETMGSAMHIGVCCSVVLAHRIDDDLWLLGGRRVVEIGERLAVDRLVERRKILPDPYRIEVRGSHQRSSVVTSERYAVGAYPTST